MARYNTSSATNTLNGTATISSPYSGAFVQLSGTAPYTVTLPSPVLFPGSNQTFHNATTGTITLSAPSGNFVGTGASGTSSTSVYAGNVVSVTSDGSNYIVISEDGSPLIATTGSFSSDVTITGASATVNIQPSSLTLYPGSSGYMDRVAIGVNTRSSAAFTTVAANAQVSLTANTASTSTSTGSLVVTGGIGVSGTINASSVVATGFTGTIQTAAQANITSLGSLTELTVLGSISSTSNAPFSLRSNGNTGTYTQTVIYNNQNNTSDNSANGIFIERGRVTDSSTGEIRSFVIGARGGEIQLILNKDGYLGIGITSPATRLDISGESIQNIGTARITNTRSGGVYYPGLIIANANGNHSYGTVADFRINGGAGTDRPAIVFSSGATATNWSIGMGVHSATDTFSIGYRNAYPLLAWATAYLTINTSGNVGIGTTDPQADLHIYKGNEEVRLHMNNSNYGSANNKGVAVGLEQSNGNMFVFNYQTGTLYFGTNATTRAMFQADGHFRPANNNELDLGTSANRWRNVYTNDLNLSNEDKEGGNEVDGTTGSWTVQEGAEDLYLINRKTGKKYRFKLEEL